MGLGLIDDIEDINESYDKGYSLIGSLTAASLLEHVLYDDDVIKVHDVIRDLALWIACDSGTNRNKWLVKEGVGLEEVRNEVVAKWGVAERISLMRNAIKELPPHLPQCANLSTLILQGNKLVGIPVGFFTCMPNLIYLDLSLNELKEFPKEICCLVQLRYLNMPYTKISSLPEEVGQLINLKYLLLAEFRGEVIRGIIGRLEKLEYLDLYPYGSVETECLPPLLKGLGMKITSEDALQQLSRVVPSILHLNIEDILGGDSSTTTSIHLHHLFSSRTKQSLRKLRISRCYSIRELDIVDVRLPRLESLDLDDLENLTEIVWRRSSIVPPSECFQRLRELRIWKCHGLKDITWVLHLPCLKILYLRACDEMEQVVVIGGGEITEPTFPRLRQLYLYNLPKLTMICDNHTIAGAAVNSPSLEFLTVMECKELKKLPFHPQLLNNNCSRLKEIRGYREWWEGIEWEEDQKSAQSSPLLQPYFKARG